VHHFACSLLLSFRSTVAAACPFAGSNLFIGKLLTVCADYLPQFPPLLTAQPSQQEVFPQRIAPAESNMTQPSSWYWGYNTTDGPRLWGGHYPSCNGREQSPIDITTSNVVLRATNALQLDWRPVGGLAVKDTGHGIQVDSPQGGTTTFEGQDYAMLQFHFHHASENRIDGKQFPLEMHVVHKNAANGKLLVVGVLFADGAANGFLSKLSWDNLPTGGRDAHNVHNEATDATHQDATAVTLAGPINVIDALPPLRNYWTWVGSLTTPPCTEGVTWVLMQQPVSISKEQQQRFPYPHNFRLVQPLYARTVYYLSASSSQPPASLVEADKRVMRNGQMPRRAPGHVFQDNAPTPGCAARTAATAGAVCLAALALLWHTAAQ
jgi:carbonic anhydrase